MTNKEAITKFRQQLDEACVKHAYKKDTQMVRLESITLKEARILRDECDDMLKDIRNEEDSHEADPMRSPYLQPIAPFVYEAGSGMSMAKAALQWMREARKQGDSPDGDAETIIRDSEECTAVIWPHNGEDGTDEDSEECDGNYWLDVFADGSSIECCPDGYENVLTAAETKRVAGHWADYKEIKNQIKGRPYENRPPNRIR